MLNAKCKNDTKWDENGKMEVLERNILRSYIYKIT